MLDTQGIEPETISGTQPQTTPIPGKIVSMTYATYLHCCITRVRNDKTARYGVLVTSSFGQKSTINTRVNKAVKISMIYCGSSYVCFVIFSV